jgi:hypothetical protein
MERAMRHARRIGTTVMIALAGVAGAGEAQPLSTACETARGVCLAPRAPVGTPCVCGDGDRGRMVFLRPAPGTQTGGLGTACGTPFGVCPAPSPLPIGARCACIGPRGPDPGQIIGGR